MLLILVVLLTSGSVTSLDKVTRMAGSAWQWMTAPPEPDVQRHSVNAITEKEVAPVIEPALSVKEEPPTKPIEVARVPDPILISNVPISDLQAAIGVIESDRLRDSGLVATLRAWNLAVLGDIPRDNSVASMRGFASENGLTFLEHRIEFDQLETINAPALIEIRKGNGTSWVGLLGLDGDKALVPLEDTQPRRVPRAQLEASYTGRAIYMWADPSPNKEMIGFFRRGALVSELQDDLRTLGIFSGMSSGIYDESTAQCVVQVQQAVGLSPDAVVGSHTRMVLNSWLGNSPTLNGSAFPDAVREIVLAEQARLPQFPTEPRITGIQIGGPAAEPPSIEAVDLPEGASIPPEGTPANQPLREELLNEVNKALGEAEAQTAPPAETDPVEALPEQELIPLTDGSPPFSDTFESSAYQSVLQTDAIPLEKDVTPPSPSQAPLRPRLGREAVE